MEAELIWTAKRGGRAEAGAATREERMADVLDAHGPALRRVAATYERDPALREDLYQEICLALWKALPRFRGEGSLAAFVFRIAHNRGLSHGWREGRSPGRLEEPETLVDPRVTPEQKAAGRQRVADLFAAVRTLPVGQRQVISLRLEGLSYREIGEVLGVSENAAMVRASRGRDALREALGEEGDER